MEERQICSLYSLMAAQVTHLAHTCTSLVNPQRRESRWPLCYHDRDVEVTATSVKHILVKYASKYKHIKTHPCHVNFI